MSGGHNHGGHHMGHDMNMHHMVSTENDTLSNVMTTASTLLTTMQSMLTTMAPNTHQDVANPSKHVHHSDISPTMHSHGESGIEVHDSSAHGGSNGHMLMYFHSSIDATILFKEWEVSTVGGLIGSMVGIFLIAMMYEGLKFFREYLFKQYFSSLQYSTVSVSGQDGKAITEIHKIARNRMLSWPHAIQTVLHIVQMVISYLLMLIFMTYNVWLCIAVTFGAGAGYFLFGWRKATIVDVTEHCH